MAAVFWKALLQGLWPAPLRFAAAHLCRHSKRAHLLALTIAGLLLAVALVHAVLALHGRTTTRPLSRAIRVRPAWGTAVLAQAGLAALMLYWIPAAITSEP